MPPSAFAPDGSVSTFRFRIIQEILGASRFEKNVGNFHTGVAFPLTLDRHPISQVFDFKILSLGTAVAYRNHQEVNLHQIKKERPK
jgi:hypothetical protein